QEEQDIVFRLGSDGAIKLWLNNKLIISSDAYRGISLDQNVVQVRLGKGWNKVLIKDCQKGGPWRFMLRLTDPNGKPLNNLKYASKPDEIKEILTSAGGTIPTVPEQSVVTPITGSVLTASYAQPTVFSYLESKIQENPNDAVSLRRLSFLYDTRKMLDENNRKDRDYLKRALELDDKDVLTHIAFTHSEPDRNKRLESYNKAVALAPQSPLVYYEYSRTYTTDPSFFKGLEFDWSEYFEELIDKYRSGEESSGDDERVDYEKEIRKAQKHTLSPKRMPFPLEAKEIEYLQKALELKPDFVKAQIALGKIYQRKSSGSQTYSRYNNRADIWQKEANRIFEEILKILPDSIELQESIFNAKERTIDEKIGFYEKLLGTDFTYNKARSKLISLYRKKGNYQKALELSAEMLKINPYNHKAYETIASIYKSQDNWTNAILAIKNGIAISPENISLHQQLANYYLYQNDTESAIASLEKALKIKPQLKEVEKHLKYLKEREKGNDFWDGYDEKLLTYIEKAKTAVQSEEKESARWMLYNQIIRVKPNGTSSIYIQQVIKVFDDNGRNNYNSVYAFPRGFDYYPSTKSEIKQTKVYRKQSARSAETRQAESNDYVEIEGQYWENSSYATFPRLEIDDIIVFECQIDEVGEGRYRDYFGLMCPLQNRSEPVDTAKLTLITPKDKPVYYQAIRCANPQPNEMEKDNQIIRIWTEANIPEIKEEYFMPAAFEIWPYVHFSTFKTWDEVAEWFWGIAKDQMETSPELKSAVNKSIEGITDTKEKIKAIYQLLVSSIRYEEISLESHYFKPFKASDTFARKYGDCKDTAILMMAMLKEAGIQADPVLIRAMPNRMGVINTELPSMKIFNHAIAHLYDKDGNDFFLDGTARYYGAEELPFMDQGAVAFIISPTGHSKCLITEHKPAETNLIELNYTIEISPTKDALLQEKSIIRGLNAPQYREQFQDGTKQKLIYEQMCNQYFKGTTVTSLEFSDLKNYNQPVEMKASVKVSEFVRVEADKMLFKLVPIQPGIFGMPLSSITSAQTRYYDMVLYYPMMIKTKITYKIPNNYSIKTIPENMTLDNDYAQFNCLASKVDDSTIDVNIEFTIKTVRITKNEYNQFRDFCAKVHKTAEREIVLEAK
ncbi:MAG: DUF3857 domain-containing protein, partial [Planctomycetota bacterium]